MGYEIIFHTLLGYGFAALAGLGGFTIFEDPNRDAVRLRLSYAFGIGGTILAAACIYLGFF